MTKRIIKVMVIVCSVNKHFLKIILSMWVEFVVGSRPFSESFSPVLKKQHFQMPILSDE